ncbi:MAG: hypothetical protein Q8O14_07730 [bacterium]|nr:hypothetical protein [bacterium]
MSSAIEIAYVRTLSKAEDRKDKRKIVRVANTVLQELGGRGKWLKISNSNRRIYRQCYGGGNVSGLSADTIELDYDGLSELGLVKNCGREIVKLLPVSSFIGQLNHPDDKHRWVIRVSILAIIMGIIISLITLKFANG